MRIKNAGQNLLFQIHLITLSLCFTSFNFLYIGKGVTFSVSCVKVKLICVLIDMYYYYPLIRSIIKASLTL